MEVPPNPTPEAAANLYDTVTDLFASYGWGILLLLVMLNLLWSHFYPKWLAWKEKSEDEKLNEEYKNNPDLLLAREEGLQRARERLLLKHQQLEQEHEEKMKEQEEKKRQEKIQIWEQLQTGRTLQDHKESNSSKNKNKSFREPTYNPLTGTGGGSCSFRPSRRGMSGGGG